MKKYFLSILYVLFLYFFWVGLISSSLGLKPPAGAVAFVFGLFLAYPIASNAEKKGYSWWKNFLVFGFLSTGMPLIGIVKLIHLLNTNKRADNNPNLNSEIVLKVEKALDA